MWRLWVLIGWLIWLATIFSSGMMNFLAGYELGRSGYEALVFGVLGVGADLWKALGPLFIVALWRTNRLVVAGFASLVWVICFVVAITAAMGLAAKNRSAMTGAHANVQVTLQQVEADLERTKQARKALGVQSSPEELDAKIASLLAQPVETRGRFRGTVAAVSSNCTNPDWRTAEACGSVAQLKEQLARAKAGAGLDRRIAELRQEAQVLRQAGGGQDADPQAKIISRLSFGMLPTSEVGLVLVLLLVAMIELVSAFTPVVLTEYAHAARGTGIAEPVQVRETRKEPAENLPLAPNARRLQVVDGIFEYMAERIRPADGVSVRGRDLYADYEQWCGEEGRGALPHTTFFQEFERICADELGGSIRRSGARYVGLMFANGVKALEPPSAGVR